MPRFRLLLVDDEEEFLEVFAMRLAARGFDVETAPNGEAALEMARDKTFDVAVLDLSMPGIDGIETLVRLRSIDSDLQVILLTGHSTTDRGSAALKLGAVDFVAKPADFQELFDKIVAASERKRELLQASED